MGQPVDNLFKCLDCISEAILIEGCYHLCRVRDAKLGQFVESTFSDKVLAVPLQKGKAQMNTEHSFGKQSLNLLGSENETTFANEMTLLLCLCMDLGYYATTCVCV